MEQLLAHLVGDYCLQNHWMAINKTKAWTPAIVHVVLYGVPFLLLVDNAWQLAVIVITHLLIDRFRLASYWVDFWGSGKAGWLPAIVEQFIRPGGVSPPDWHTEMAEDYGFSPSCLPAPAPPFLGVWLLIIIDNTMHLCINYAALRWL